MAPVYLSLGSNLGDRLQYLMRAVELLQELGPITGYSRLYRTDPILYTQQPEFLNCALRIDTELPPAEVLRCVKRIEGSLGRTFTVEKGPREIDIDISLYGDEVVSEPDLTIPHPGVTQRDFVIITLLNIDPLLSAQGRPLLDYLEAAFVSHPRLLFPTPGRGIEFGGPRTLIFGVVEGEESGRRQLAAGADILDLCSLELLRALRPAFRDALLCVSVSKPSEAEEAIALKADVIRDESGGDCALVCARVPYILVRHSSAPLAPTEWKGFNAMIDPGKGLQSLRGLSELKAHCHLPLVVDAVEPLEKTDASLAVVSVAAHAKVDFVRVRDVSRTRRFLDDLDQVYRS